MEFLIPGPVSVFALSDPLQTAFAARLTVLCYTFAHEPKYTKKVYGAVRRYGGRHLSFIAVGMGSDFRAFGAISQRSAGAGCGGSLSVSRVHCGMEGLGRKHAQQGSIGAADAVERFCGARGGEVQRAQDRAMESHFPFHGCEVSGAVPSRGRESRSVHHFCSSSLPPCPSPAGRA